MGNCQATEAATVVIQHPGGRVERLYWPTTVGEMMRSNPGHYVALVTLCVTEDGGSNGGTVRLTRVKLLKPKDMLLLGQAYRLVTSQEVSKALRARKQEKMNKAQSEMIKQQQQQQQHHHHHHQNHHQQQLQRTRDDRGVEQLKDSRQLVAETIYQGAKQEGDRLRGSRSRHWRPSLQSISEAVI